MAQRLIILLNRTESDMEVSRFRLGYWYEYKDPEAYAACQLVWQEIEKAGKARSPIKVFANRGVVLEDNKLSDG